jgi:hypothetical protein
MSEEVDTSAELSPDMGQEPPEPTATEPEPETQAQAGEASPPPPPEPQVDPVESRISEALEKQKQQLMSWIGRRDAELFQRLEQQKYQAPVPQKDPETLRNELLDDPEAFISQALSRTISKMDQQNKTFTQSVFSQAGQLMETDPLFADKDLGNEVIKEIQGMAGRVDMGLPPHIAAKQLVSDATLAVIRRKKATPVNPLARNTPVRTPVGGVSPPAAPKQTAKVPALSERTAALAKRWGYKSDDLAKIFKE